MDTQCLRYYSDAHFFTLKLPHRTEHCVSICAGGEGSLFETLRRKIAELDGAVLSQFVLAGCRHYDRGMAELGAVRWPVTWIQGDACQSGQVYSSQILALAGTELTPIRLDGELVGYRYEDATARFCRLSSLKPKDLKASRAQQARSLFERMAAALDLAGMRFTDTVRTWLYLDSLLDWYDEFNAVRTAFFEAQGVFGGRVPASTGIGAANPWGAAILADLWAVAPRGEACTIQEVASPLQCPAPDYRSSFSRAVELTFPTHRQLLISGTASIDPEGRTAYPGDCEAQIELTMQVVRELLASRGMDWKDLARGIAYFKRRADVALWERWSARQELPPFSLAVSHADICRRDLLFEIELDAVQC